MIKFVLTLMMMLSVITVTTFEVEGVTAGNITVSGEATTTLIGGSTVTYTSPSGGGGGGGGLSGENFTNIEVNEKYDLYSYFEAKTDTFSSFAFCAFYIFGHRNG